MHFSEIAHKYNIDFDEKKVKTALENAMLITKRNIIKFQDAFTSICTSNGLYRYSGTSNHISIEWFHGFWCGIVWLAYEISGDYKIRCYGEKLTHIVHSKLVKSGMGYNDIGMLVILSCVANYKVTGNKLAREMAVIASDSLLSRFISSQNVLSSYDFERDNNIITLKTTSIVNVFILRFAYMFTGNTKYKDFFQKNVDLILDNNVTSDGKTFFNSYFDQSLGKKVNASVEYIPWVDNGDRSRSYSWMLFALAGLYSMSGEKRYADIYARVYRYMTGEWTEDNFLRSLFAGDRMVVDTTSASILASALVDMSKHAELPDSGDYAKMAVRLINILIDSYSVKYGTNCEGLLKGGYFFNYTAGNNESVIVGDYFYLEALADLLIDRRSYWC